jgi:ABC-type multidrug transport system fused ATPase/permease subunit
MRLAPRCHFIWWDHKRKYIAYGKPDATETEIMLAAKQANALNFIESFPENSKQLWEKEEKLSEVKDNASL